MSRRRTRRKPWKVELSAEKKGVVVGKFKSGMSLKDISRSELLNYDTVVKLVRRYRERGSTENLPRSGRPKVTTEIEDIDVRNEANRHPFSSSKQIAAAVQDRKGKLISARTVRRRLCETFDVHGRTPARKPLMSARNLGDRKLFDQNYGGMSAEDWLTTLISDEATVSQFGSLKRVVWRPPHTRFDSRFTQATVKHPPAVMVWACISGNGAGNIVVLDAGTMVDKHVYFDIVCEHAVPSMERLGCTRFQQDNAPCHKAKFIMEFLENRFEVMEWPGNSADLSPIENVWPILKAGVAELKPRNVAELKTAIVDVWRQKVTPDLCRKLMLSMPDRIRAMRNNKYFPSKY